MAYPPMALIRFTKNIHNQINIFHINFLYIETCVLNEIFEA